MPSIPLPFVVSPVLCLVRMVRQGDNRLGLFPPLVPVSAVQASLSGLNWSVGGSCELHKYRLMYST